MNKGTLDNALEGIEKIFGIYQYQEDEDDSEGNTVKMFIKILEGHRGIIFIEDFHMLETSNGDKVRRGDHIDLWRGYEDSWLFWTTNYDGPAGRGIKVAKQISEGKYPANKADENTPYTKAKYIHFWPVAQKKFKRS